MASNPESLVATKLKRKLPQSAYPDKICKWCGSTIVRTRQSLSEWKEITTCGGSCATYWRWNKCSKADLPPEPTHKPCKTCGATLERKEGEHKQAWVKRLFCDKACAAKNNSGHRVKIPIASFEDRLHLKRYIPGTPEFKAIAALYGG